MLDKSCEILFTKGSFRGAAKYDGQIFHSLYRMLADYCFAAAGRRCGTARVRIGFHAIYLGAAKTW
jgi:hypothetical protein